MSQLDEIIDRLRDRARADFAFVLSRRGRLVTRHAPENMPEQGRAELCEIAEPLLGSDDIVLRTMPREALVPYGGAAPIDVFVAARDAAIVCVVMATWVDQGEAIPAMRDAFEELDGFIGAELQRRHPSVVPKAPTPRRRRRTNPPGEKTASPSRPGSRVPPAAPSSRSGRAGKRGPPPLPARAARPDPRARAVPPNAEVDEVAPDPPSFRNTLPLFPSQTQERARRKAPARREASMPAIELGEATLGRATIAAIETEETGPDIHIGVAALGRESLAAIDAALVPPGSPGSAPTIRVTLATAPDIDLADLELTDRATLPFTELASDAKRTFDAQFDRRGAAPPEVQVRLQNLDFDTQTVVDDDTQRELEAVARQARKRAERQAERNSNLDAWHQALAEFVDETKPRRRPKRA